MSGHHYDLVIIGTGSGNTLPGPEFDDWRIAIVEKGAFGGTCLNVGCIPSKMFEYPAEIADALRGAGPLGVTGTIDHVDWAAIRDRIFGRIDPIAESGRAYRSGDECPNIDVHTGVAAFTGTKRLRIALTDGTTTEITGDRFVLAAGSTPTIPEVVGLDTVPHHTSDSVMRIDALPRRAVIVGGGFIAAEFGHIFASFGTAVTQVVRGDVLLRGHDQEVAERFTEIVAARYDLRCHSRVVAARPGGDGAVVVTVSGPDGDHEVETDLLLFATGRTPNGAALEVTRTGVELDGDGYVVVDEYQRTGVDGIFALGDICSPFQLKHVANHEARVVAHNLARPDTPIAADHRYVPSAVFTHPQIASAGLTEERARAEGIAYAVGRRDYGGTAAGWAREDDTGFCKVLADPATGLLLGVHLIGPEAATVIQPALTAMQFGIAAREMARGQYWIHPALPEVLENALLDLPAPTGARG